MDPNEAAIALREAEIKKLMGVDVNFIDPTKQNSLIRTIAPYISPAWGHSNYANAFDSLLLRYGRILKIGRASCRERV